jgi:hypothetical protein
MAMREAIARRLGMQMPDSRGPQGIMARGANVYNGGAPQAHMGGGPQFGRPPGPAQPPLTSSGPPQAQPGVPGEMTTLVGSLPPITGGAPGVPGAPPAGANSQGIGPGGVPGLMGMPPGQDSQGDTDQAVRDTIMGILRAKFQGGGVSG